MSTLVYSPGVEVRIDTARDGVIDVSDDISNLTLALTPDEGGSKLNLVLTNNRRKYDGLFTPNDRVTVRMKRVTWVRVFSGYLTQVPYFSVYGKDVRLTADDSLKRLKYTFWDPGAQDSFNLLQGAVNPNRNAGETDSGIRDLMVRLLTDVGHWDSQNIHIGQIPRTWFQRVDSLRTTLSQQIQIDPSMLGEGAVIAGQGASGAGTYTVVGLGPNTGTGEIPNPSSRVSVVGPASGISLTSGDPSGEFYCQMRWPYLAPNPTTSRGYDFIAGINANDRRKAQDWWNQQRILVVNPKNQRAVVVRPWAWGPNPRSGSDLGLSKHAMATVLGAEENDLLQVRFTTPDTKLGPAEVLATPTHVVAGSGQAPNAGSASADPSGSTALLDARFEASNNLKPNVAAARSFVKANWPGKPAIGGYSKRNIAGTSTPSDHSTGLALDVMVNGGGKMPSPAEVAYGNAVAMWFSQNPQAFGVKYIIWNGRINTGGSGDTRGWRPYVHGGKSGAALGATQGHFDHVHVSFFNTGQASLGTLGDGWTGSSSESFAGGFETGLTSGGNTGSSGLVNINWNPQVDPESQLLAGPRALMNDYPLLSSIKMLTHASMRSYMAAPNGDFISWFPDYFGQYGTASRIAIEPIELEGDGFSMVWSDDALITHQFTAGATSNLAGGSDLTPAFDTYRMATTTGIASVDFPEIMEALFNVDRNDPRTKAWVDRDSIIQRFGARPDFQSMPLISGSTAEFWYALFLFQKNWASQFSSSINLTFMPEVWPGMLLWIKTYGFQAYVESVTHSIDFNGGGFSTDVSVIAPSATDGSGLYGLPRGGFKGQK